uniref:Uncharacterized protein n=1 Tax=Podoviridae sp. ctLPy3 TaxID=2825244 RepID=A0A8S5UWS3_9CAUD|nr:MAG TPA: hypothetical protein [Caudoviricetes sp.]DAF98814.1 MAG TPA: hypothetical protein [Podoviridae sp. ctLPy3]DAV41495.1 MAG TPA: hypothetical protein [Caudoviricetes sp.]DAW20073.1 MAG TPA: hypothetical protein [Caudoviricetes sp.]DAW89311.1 MAG TPA: hypothetical protein [Caudoviricetes sp.]
MQLLLLYLYSLYSCIFVSTKESLSHHSVKLPSI